MLAKKVTTLSTGVQPTIMVQSLSDHGLHYHITFPSPSSGFNEWDFINQVEDDPLFGTVFFGPQFFAASFDITAAGSIRLDPNTLGAAYSITGDIVAFGVNVLHFEVSGSNDGNPISVGPGAATISSTSFGEVSLIWSSTLPGGVFAFFTPDITLDGAFVRPTGGGDVLNAYALTAPRVANSSKIESVKVARQSVTAVPICD